MYKNKRQHEILEYIYLKKEASVNELSKEFGVSKVTVRKDLVELAEKGNIKKTHGGAVSSEKIMVNEDPYYRRQVTNLEQKIRIGEKAASLIKDKDIVMIDTGSTTFEVAPYLTEKEIVVVTNDVKIAYKLAPYPNLNVVVAGGYIKAGAYSLFGPMAEQLYKDTIANVCILAVDSIDVNYGVSYNFLDAIAVKNNMIKSSEKIIGICDSSKIGKKSFAKLCDVQELDILVTDAMSTEMKSAFEEKGLEVILADE